MSTNESREDDKRTEQNPSSAPPLRHSVDTDQGAPDDQPNPGDPGPPVLKPSEKDMLRR